MHDVLRKNLPFAHIDNVTVRIQRSQLHHKPGRKLTKLDFNWPKFYDIFFCAKIYGGYSTYKYFDSTNKVSYKLRGNTFTISLAKQPFDTFNYHKIFIDSLVRLMNKGVIATPSLDKKYYNDRARQILMSRGKVKLEHAIDMHKEDAVITFPQFTSAGSRYIRNRGSGVLRLETIKQMDYSEFYDAHFLSPNNYLEGYLTNFNNIFMQLDIPKKNPQLATNEGEKINSRLKEYSETIGGVTTRVHPIILNHFKDITNRHVVLIRRLFSPIECVRYFRCKKGSKRLQPTIANLIITRDFSVLPEEDRELINGLSYQNQI